MPTVHRARQQRARHAALVVAVRAAERGRPAR